MPRRAKSMLLRKGADWEPFLWLLWYGIDPPSALRFLDYLRSIAPPVRHGVGVR